jgi:hypothetical protein
MSLPGTGWSFHVVLIRMPCTSWVIYVRRVLRKSGITTIISNSGKSYLKAGKTLIFALIAAKAWMFGGKGGPRARRPKGNY